LYHLKVVYVIRNARIWVIKVTFALIGVSVALLLSSALGLRAQAQSRDAQHSVTTEAQGPSFQNTLTAEKDPGSAADPGASEKQDSEPEAALSDPSTAPSGKMDELASSALPVAALLGQPVTTPEYTPLTLKQKYLYSINEIFGISPLLAVGVHAVLDQAGVSPVQWGKGADSFGVRVASHFGNLLLRHNLEFAVRALDHEDPRYFRLGQGSGWIRAKYAVVHTFEARRDSGGNMPAYSLFVTDFGMPFVVRQWNPGNRMHPLNEVEAGTLAIGIGMGTNLFNEFWPDLRKKIPNRLSRGPMSRFLNHPQP
jgi:hypothetical protein